MASQRIIRSLKRFLGSTEPDSDPYECSGCGRSFDVEHHVCPICGSYRVDRRKYCLRRSS